MTERKHQPVTPPPMVIEIPSHGPGLVSSIKAFGPSPEALVPDAVQLKVDAAVAAETVELVKRNRKQNAERRAAEWEREQQRLADDLARHQSRKP